MNRPVLEIKNLTVAYHHEAVLDQVSVHFQPGVITGIMGPNGAGKSTLIKAIMGLVRPQQGDILAFDQAISKVRRRITYLPQRGDVDWDFPVTVYDVVMMGRYGNLSLFGRPGKRDQQAVWEALDAVGIGSLADRQISQLSGGQQQRIFLARALAHHGDLFLMDEPFVGVDAATEEAIVQVMRQLKASGKTLIVVNHDLQTAKNYFDRLLLLNRQVVVEGIISDVFTPYWLQKTYGNRLTVVESAGGKALIVE